MRMRPNNKGRPYITIELMMSLPDVTSDDIMVQGAGIDNVRPKLALYIVLLIYCLWAQNVPNTTKHDVLFCLGLETYLSKVSSC